MKKSIAVLLVLLLCVPAGAQSVTLTFAWDPSPDDTRVAGAANPVRYRLCFAASAPGLPLPADRACLDTQTELTGVITFTPGIHYVFATAFRNAVDVDGSPVGTDVLESGPSNTLVARVWVPPGNPRNFKVKIVP